MITHEGVRQFRDSDPSLASAAFQTFRVELGGGLADAVRIDGIEAVAQRAGVVAGHDAAISEHDQMSVVDREERIEEERFCVLEILTEDARHVLGSEGHKGRPEARIQNTEDTRRKTEGSGSLPIIWLRRE